MKNLAILIFLVTFSKIGVSSNLTEVDLATIDLANRLQVPVAQVSVACITEKTWPDSSMGCPQPGYAYRQVLVEGSQLRLMVAKKPYYYHAGGNKKYFFCANPKTESIKKSLIGGPET